MRAALGLTAMLMAGCASLPQGEIYEASFQEQPSAETKEAIRQHVRSHLGADYIVDFGVSDWIPKITARDRGRATATGVGLPVEPKTFEFLGTVSRSGSTCWMVLEGERGRYSVPPLDLGDACDFAIPT